MQRGRVDPALVEIVDLVEERAAFHGEHGVIGGSSANGLDAAYLHLGVPHLDRAEPHLVAEPLSDVPGHVHGARLGRGLGDRDRRRAGLGHRRRLRSRMRCGEERGGERDGGRHPERHEALVVRRAEREARP